VTSIKSVLKLIDFQKTTKQARILSPLKNFAEETIAFEYRTDPLTGRNTSVIKGMLGYVIKIHAFTSKPLALANRLRLKHRLSFSKILDSCCINSNLFSDLDFLKVSAIRQ
jgi:hypothetical protein